MLLHAAENMWFHVTVLLTVFTVATNTLSVLAGSIFALLLSASLWILCMLRVTLGIHPPNLCFFQLEKH